MNPLDEDSLIAVIKMAREIRIRMLAMLVFVFLFIQVNFAHDKCIVCKKNVKGPKDARSDTLYRDHFAACFGISDSAVGKKSRH